MLIKTVSGDDIYDMLNTAMHATVGVLVSDGLLNKQDADDFKNTHFCTIVDSTQKFSLIRKMLGLKADESVTVVCKIKR